MSKERQGIVNECYNLLEKIKDRVEFNFPILNDNELKIQKEFLQECLSNLSGEF